MIIRPRQINRGGGCFAALHEVGELVEHSFLSCDNDWTDPMEWYMTTRILRSIREGFCSTFYFVAS